MLLAAYVERELRDTNVSILDLKVTPVMPENIGSLLKDKPGVVGLSGLTVHSQWLHRTAAGVRAAVPEALILAGGPHATCFPSRVLEDHNIDAVALGEGERILLNALRAQRERRPLETVAGIGTRDRLDPDQRDMIGDLDKLPFPAWHKVDVNVYARHLSFAVLGRRRYMQLVTSRGCPYNCIYCHNLFGKRFRARSPENVLEEIKTLVRFHGIHNFEILDDCFNLDRDRVVNICEGILKENLEIKMAFPNGLRSDLLDDELLKLMRRAGTIFISFAIETASPRVQKFIHKNLNLDLAARALRTASKLGIFCTGFFMLGFPTETEEELNTTLQFAVRSPLQVAQFFTAMPFEGTRLYSMLDGETQALIQKSPQSLSYFNFSFKISDIPTVRFRQMIKKASKRFYLNPFRFLAILRRHPDRLGILQFWRYALRRIFLKQE